MEQVRNFGRRALATLDGLERREKLMIGGGLGILLSMMSLVAVFHESILKWMANASTEFRQWPVSWLLLIVGFIIISFPPLVGYSLLSVFTGMSYGIVRGWPILASGTVIGSFLAFIVFRYLLRERAAKLASSSIKFLAFSKTLEKDSFVLLWMIRLCPLPYSLSNAAMSSVPSVEPWKFLAATVCTTPKLFIHVFIGSRLARLSDTKDNGVWWANLISIIIALAVGVTVSWLIYKRTKERAALLEAQHRAEHGDLEADADDFEIDDEEEYDPNREFDQDIENPFASPEDTIRETV